jgi:hypothetical protein
MELTGTTRIFYPTAAEYTFLSETYRLSFKQKTFYTKNKSKQVHKI